MNILVESSASWRLALEPYNALCNFVAGHSWRSAPLPAGDGHPVVVYPGLGVSGAATTDLRTRLLQLGYQVYDWEMGVGTWPCTSFDVWLGPMARQLQQIHRAHASPASLIGWSLGGLYARELAKLHPQAVRQVITLGTPLGAGRNVFAPHGTAPDHAGGATLSARLQRPPPVACTSIYSRTDGLVDWKDCVDPALPEARNIEVSGASHFGLVHHPGVLGEVAHLLAAPPAPPHSQAVSARSITEGVTP